ncbi:MAG: peptidylprolyl isomerase [Oscillospiraceae bacterium]|nr:peptidylprolyl isomerase [Oscillospiraceae bacterium]
MSASKERQERAGLRESGSYKKLNEKAEEELKEKRRRTKTWIILAVIVVLAIIVVLFGTNVLYSNVAAVRAGSEKYTAADYNYFYSSMEQNYRSYYESVYGSSDYLDMLMPDADTMKQTTLNTMQSVAMRAGEAKKAGFTLSEDARSTIESQIAALENAAVNNGLTTDDFIAASFGRGVTEKVLRRDMEKWMLADEYTAYLRESYDYSDEELDAYYAEHKNDIDSVTYNTYYVDGSAVEADEETGTQAVDADTAMAEARETAEAFGMRLSEGEAFNAVAASLVSEDEQAFYSDEESTKVTTTYAGTSALYADWLFDEARAAGESAWFPYESEEEGAGQGYYVVQFLSREDISYTLRNVRHILIEPAEVDEADYENDDAGYEEAVELARSAALATAQDIYDEWKNGDATEDSFAALATEHSDDAGSAESGGLIENLYKGRTTAAFENWCFEPDRKTGDTDIIESTFGYHIMYFVSEGEPYSRYTARTRYVEETYDQWEETALESYPISTTGLFPIANLFDVLNK